VTALIVIAKAPRPGRVKTRLCPPCTPEQAAALAEAALRDTLTAVAATPADCRVLVLDGPAGDWLPPGFLLRRQRGDGLGERLAAAFADTGGPALLVGMDTPQLTPSRIAAGLAQLRRADAVLGRSTDGGYWAIGLRTPDPRVFDGVPMSREHTGAMQLSRLKALGLRIRELGELRDVDTFADARAVAVAAPGTRFAHAMERLERARAAA
jgi:hypothetical protein